MAGVDTPIPLLSPLMAGFFLAELPGRAAQLDDPLA